MVPRLLPAAPCPVEHPTAPLPLWAVLPTPTGRRLPWVVACRAHTPGRRVACRVPLVAPLLPRPCLVGPLEAWRAP